MLFFRCYQVTIGINRKHTLIGWLVDFVVNIINFVPIQHSPGHFNPFPRQVWYISWWSQDNHPFSHRNYEDTLYPRNQSNIIAKIDCGRLRWYPTKNVNEKLSWIAVANIVNIILYRQLPWFRIEIPNIHVPINPILLTIIPQYYYTSY